MSEHLHPTRLEWDGRRGMARHDGVQVELRSAPLRFAEVHYTPGIQYDVRDNGASARREMTQAEIGDCQRYLLRLAHRCHQVALQP